MTISAYNSATALVEALNQKASEKSALENAQASGFTGMRWLFSYEGGSKTIEVDYSTDATMADSLYTRAIDDLDDKISELTTALAAL